MSDKSAISTIKRPSIWHKDSAFRQLVLFFMISNGVTVMQLLLMPILKHLFSYTSLTEITFQFLPLGLGDNGDPRFLFDYAKGTLSSGGGGGLAYFLSVEITLFLAQIVNFFLQRNITFQSNTSVFKAAVWYFTAWILISVGGAVLNSFYKMPVYHRMTILFGNQWGMLAGDLITMLINCILSFWIFFPIMKFIFRSDRKQQEANDYV